MTITKQYWFLRIGSDCLDDALCYQTKQAAVNKYQRVAQELARYEQRIEASLHRASRRETLDEYPDFVLSLGVRGGVRVEAC